MSTADEIYMTATEVNRRMDEGLRRMADRFRQVVLAPLEARVFWRCELILAADQGQRLLTYTP